ncbi:MAG TPA: phosphoglycerate kinase [Patescibacteria group bacterium]|nr:phosphoglycerate kinase [Patescibacteria group bacterium]
MSFYKQTIDDVPLDGQRVLVRVDYNVPLLNSGKIADDFRIQQSLPTLRSLLERGCALVICSHLGRPDGQVQPKFSLGQVAEHLGELLQRPVTFVNDCVGDQVIQATKRMSPGQIVMLENLRFHAEEETNDTTFAKALAVDTGATYFVQDAFGVVHRAHASTVAITHFLPSVAGLLLKKEVVSIESAISNPKRPLVAVLGGAKVSDKLKLVERFVNIADQLIIGGAMANTFLQYKGLQIGKSVHEDDQSAELARIYTLALNKMEGKSSIDDFILLPIDVAVATQLDGTDQRRVVVDVHAVTADEYIVDVGAQTIALIVSKLQGAGTVIWNGTLGLAEYSIFAEGSARLADALAAAKDHTLSIIGGGDTADFVLHHDNLKGASFGHVSTGGGASLDLMAGDKLPGVEALMDSTNS